MGPTTTILADHVASHTGLPSPAPLLSPCTAPVGRGRRQGHRSCFLLGVVLKGKAPGQQKAGQDLGSPWRAELRLLRLAERPDQYVKEKEGRERAIRRKCNFPQFLSEFHGQSWHKWCRDHIFSIFVEDVAWPK